MQLPPPPAHVGLKTAFFQPPARSARRTVCELAGHQKLPEFITPGPSALAPAIDLATGSCFSPSSRTSKRTFQFHSTGITCDFHRGPLIKECLQRYLFQKTGCKHFKVQRRRCQLSIQGCQRRSLWVGPSKALFLINKSGISGK